MTFTRVVPRGLTVVLCIAACGGAAAPPPVPQHRTASVRRQLPDDACLRLAAEREPGACRLRGETHPPTGRRCVAALDELGGRNLALNCCYRADGAAFTLDHATLDKDEAEVVFEYDGTQCWIVGAATWATVPEAVRAFVVEATGCTKVRDDYVF